MNGFEEKRRVIDAMLGKKKGGGQGEMKKGKESKINHSVQIGRALTNCDAYLTASYFSPDNNRLQIKCDYANLI